MDKKEVVVVVPVYRPELTVWERASLRQTVGVLQENYPVELLVPCGMDCSAIRREFSGLPGGVGRMAGPQERDCGIQPDDAFGRILRVVPRLRISPDLPYRRLDFPGRTRRLVP